MIHPVILFGKEIDTSPALDSLKAPTFFTGQRMRAVLKVPHDKRHQCPMFDTVKLILRGQVSNHVTLNGLCWRIEKPLVRMSCVKLAEDFQQKLCEDSDSVSNETSFFFDIPEFTTLPSLHGIESEHTLQHLPPSIRTIKQAPNEWLVGDRAGVCKVTYHVEAKFFLNGRSVSDWRREIIVMPVGEIPPPMDPEGLQKEYTLSATLAFRSFWRRKRRVILRGSSSEPRPFVIQPTTRRSLIPGTDLILNFSTQTILHDNIEAEFSEPQFTACEVLITLEATTFFQEKEQESVMSIAEARDHQLVVFKTVRFQPQIRKMTLGQWYKTKESIAGSNRIVEWSTETSVTALLPLDAPKLPSFFSSLVSQRYAFDVEVRFGTEAGIRSRKPMKLRIPVQMVHASLGKGGTDLPDAEFEDDLEVPAYAP